MATQSTKDRIDRLYTYWVGYAPIAEEGESARDTIKTLREYLAAMKESENVTF